MNTTRIFVGIIFSICSLSGQAQNELERTLDSLGQAEDTSSYFTFDSTSFLIDSSASTIRVDTTLKYDDTELTVREVDEEKINNLKRDPNLDYTVTPRAQSLWSRVLWWLLSLFVSLVDGTEGGSWLRYGFWGVAVAILIYVILKLLKIDAIKMFYSGQGKSITYTAIDENIHEMDFDKLIANAVAAKDFRLAIRLQFLHALKILSDKHLIHWQPGKTNHDYMLELGKSNLRPGFTELNEYFEYAWYGNFAIAPELFGKVQGIFNTWRRQA